MAPADFAAALRLPCITLTAVVGVVASGACAGARPPNAAPKEPVASTSSTPAPDPSALEQLDRSERSLATSAGDCGAACSALSSIVDARIRLCSPRTDACDDAERREADARRNVTATCGPCGGE